MKAEQLDKDGKTLASCAIRFSEGVAVNSYKGGFLSDFLMRELLERFKLESTKFLPSDCCVDQELLDKAVNLGFILKWEGRKSGEQLVQYSLTKKGCLFSTLSDSIKED